MNQLVCSCIELGRLLEATGPVVGLRCQRGISHHRHSVKRSGFAGVQCNTAFVVLGVDQHLRCAVAIYRKP